ncbi:MAG: AAA family ATPase [bacterium]|nr:AAA family ATPase [bacterium]
MFLKSMEMFGFKSFADRTLVEFEPGITVIVGPNGCGKSNVVDAIKWVLGEKNARNIRGDTMEDIIFSGTDNRKPLSLSEVSIAIDNTNRVLDIDSETITIGRRVFRDGESEYLINKSPVRLKDIEKLFMDTGIGKSAYSVMEQGKMDLILSTKAEDRRYLFEEAAGISRYKLQKKESLKKLKDTSDNLDRINDIIKEIEREKDLKGKQAERTSQYLGFRKEQIDFDIKLNFIKYNELAKKQEKLQGDIERLKKERETTSARVSAISAENEKDEKRKNDIQLQLFDLEKRLHAYKIRLEDIDLKTEKNRNLIEEQESRKENIDKKIEERSNNYSRLIDEKGKTEQSGIDIRKKIEEDKENLASYFEKRKSKIESIHKSRDKIEENKKNIKDNESGLKKLREALEVVIKRLVDAIDKRKAELQESEGEREEVRRNIRESINAIDHSIRDAQSSLNLGIVEEAMDHLNKIEIVALREEIEKFESYEDGFRSLLFDKTGIHAEKEEIDQQIKLHVSAIEQLRAENSMLDEQIQREQLELEDVNSMITRVEKDLSRNENERDWIEKHLQSLARQIEDVQKQIDNYREDISRSETIIAGLKKEISEWEARLIEFNERSESLVKNINDLTEKRSDLEKKVHDRKDDSKKDEEELTKVVERISSLDKNLVEMMFRKNTIEDYLWVEYEKKVGDFQNLKLDPAQYDSINAEMQEVKKKIQNLGPINNLAIEEYKDLKKRFEYYVKQKMDIEKARGDILSVIDEINRTSLEMFLDTFQEIQKNFSNIFKQLFEGGEASVELADLENVLECGIDILVRPPGKKLKNINLLSGGERALTAIALLFATYMVKPSPFCFLDEIDAPLDEENIGRFIRMMKDFARSTQFVVVSHNKKTMNIGESLYGVTMEEPGVSRVVSLRMERVMDRKTDKSGT